MATQPETTNVIVIDHPEEDDPMIKINTDRIKALGKKAARYGRVGLVVVGVSALAATAFVLANQNNDSDEDASSEPTDAERIEKITDILREVADEDKRSESSNQEN